MAKATRLSTPRPARKQQGEGDLPSAKLRPGRVRRLATSPTTGSARRLLHLVRMISRTSRMRTGPRNSPQNRIGAVSQFQRRAIVKVRYSNDRVKGAWKAHGRYLERESAAGERDGRPAERLDSEDHRPLHAIADEWHRSGDARLFKIIISPEDGSSVDFKAASQEMIHGLELQTGEKLEWAGIVHRNTEKPHTQLVLRGSTRS